MSLGRPSADGPRGTRRYLDRWSGRTAAALGSLPSDWYDPLCSALVVAVRAQHDEVAVLHRYVQRRVRWGWGLHAILDDLDRLRRSLGMRHRWSGRWRVLQREAAVAYADEMLGDLLAGAGRDALSGLPDSQFLAVHLEELVAATPADDDVRSQLVVVEAQPSGDSVTGRMAATVGTAECLRSAVPRGVLVAHVRDDCFVVVLPPLFASAPVVERIDAALRHRSEVESVVVRSIGLPRTRVELAALLAAWWRQPPPGRR